MKGKLVSKRYARTALVYAIVDALVYMYQIRPPNMHAQFTKPESGNLRVRPEHIIV